MKHIWVVENDDGLIVARADTEGQALIEEAGLKGGFIDGVEFFRASREAASRARQVRWGVVQEEEPYGLY